MDESKQVDRREFIKDGAMVAGGVAATVAAHGATGPDTSRILNYNGNMEYRRLGKTGLMVSAVCMGGHWKRMNTVTPNLFKDKASLSADLNHSDFVENRRAVINRCMEAGINYVDACMAQEVLAYGKALKGRRDKMYVGYSWYEKEARFPEWRSAQKLMQSLEDGLKAGGWDYVDLWRITCFEPGGNHTFNECEEVVAALEQAKRQGKARFTGISSHDRRWLKMMVETYPRQIEVILTPYTADSKVLPADSLFDAVKRCDAGVFGIKPFASNALFAGDSSRGNPHAEDDDRRARMAIRHVLANPAITAPIPGLINVAQVDNVVAAVKERRELDAKENLDLNKAVAEMWARLPANYGWLKDWEYV